MDLTNKIKDVYREVVEIYRHLHMHPELSEQESATADYICRTLDAHNIPYQRDIAGHGVAALIKGGGTKCIGIRADIDALPITETTGSPYASVNDGVMHACGHDMNMAILLGTGIVLSEVADQLPGSVKLIFQPAEETVGGAHQMIEEGVLKEPDVSAMIGLHVDPAYETGSVILRKGPMNAAVNDFTMQVIGKQCHGAQPERGIDPIVVAADMIMALQTVVTRFTVATDPVVVSIGSIHGGTGCNIIPGEVTMQGTLRALSKETLISIKNRVEEIAVGTAATYGASVQFSWMETPFPPLLNDDTVVDIVEKAADDMRLTIHHMPETSMGADDFAFFTEAVPGAYFNLGCAPEGTKLPPLHNGNFIGDEKALYAGMEIELKTVLSLLEKYSEFIMRP